MPRSAGEARRDATGLGGDYRMVWAGVESVESILRDLRLDAQKPVGILIDNPARHLIVALALLKVGITSTSLRSDLLETAWAAGVQILLAEGRFPRANRGARTSSMRHGSRKSEWTPARPPLSIQPGS